MLGSRAIVLVPVVNPDGYQFTHVPGGNRSWRTNRRLRTCVPPDVPKPTTAGVDINRNYAGNWGDGPVDAVEQSSNNSGCSESWQGPFASSEPETVQMQYLLDGAVPQFGPDGSALPVSATSYHTWGDLLIYPAGYKYSDTSSGLRCHPNANCLQPDFLSLRNLYGDDRTPYFRDSVAELMSQPVIPYFADQERSNGYTTTGDLTQYAEARARRPMLSVTPELGGTTGGGFYPECRSPSDRVVLLGNMVTQQKAMVRRLLSEGGSIASGYPRTTTGVFGGIFAPREKVRGRDDDTAIPRLLIARGNSAATGNTLSFQVNGAPQTFRLERRGAQYSVYSFEMPDPMTIPCQVGLAGEAKSESNCTGNINLCSATRLPKSGGWSFFNLPVESHTDCGYKALQTSSQSIITLPSWTPRAATTHCRAGFTIRWSAPTSPTVPIRLERFVGGVWKEITRWPLAAPFYELRTVGFSSTTSPRSLRSYSFDIGGAGGTPTDALRFIYDGGGDPPGAFELLDASTSCRYGDLTL